VPRTGRFRQVSGAPQASKGSAIIGTPRAVNSVAGARFGRRTIFAGIHAVFQFQSAGRDTIYGYGLKSPERRTFLPMGLILLTIRRFWQYQSVTQKTFLDANRCGLDFLPGAVGNGQPGKLVVAEARTIQPKTGANGDG